MEGLSQGLCLPASSWRWQTGLPLYTPQSHFLIRWYFLPPPQSLPTFQTFIKYKTPGLYDRTLHSTYAEKRVRHSNVQKSPVPPSPGELPCSKPHCSQPPMEHQGVLGLPVPWRGTGLLPCMVPASPACSPPAPGLEAGRQTRGDLKEMISSLLEGAPAPTKTCWGVQISPIYPTKAGRAGEGRRRQGLHAHTAPAFGEGGWDTAAIPPALGKLRHSKGHSLIRGLCLAELRQGPALSTRLKQRKTASHVCVPSSMSSAWPGQQPHPDPACLGAPGCSHPQLGQQWLQRW